MVFGILLALLVIVCLFLVLVVLLQSDKGGGLAGTFGGMGGGGGMPFSGREAATLLTKLTTTFAALFMIICISLNILGRNRSHVSNASSALQKRAQRVQKMESHVASAALDQTVIPGAADSGALFPPAESGAVNIPGVTQEAGGPPAR